LSKHKSTRQGFTNLVHFTCGSNSTRIGDRIPAIWFHQGQDRLHIVTAIDNNKNYSFNGSSPLKLGLTKIRMIQRPDANGKWYFAAVVDNNGQRIGFKRRQGTPRDFKDVKVYASDPWYVPADNAHILSLEVNNETLIKQALPANLKPASLKRGVLIKTLPKLYKRFDIKLEFFLSKHKSTRQGFTNLVHFTCGSNSTRIGDRIPAIWFHQGQDKLHILTAIDNNKNHTFNGSSPLKLGLTKIHMTQKPDANGKWCFSAVVDNNGQKKVYKCRQGIPRDFKNVKVYASDPWYEPADNAHILSLEVKTEPETVKEFSVYSDRVVHAIRVNGKKYGYTSGNQKKIKLAPGEKITKVTYGTTFYKKARRHGMCQLTFYSNKNKRYGPYGNARPNRYREVNNLPCDWSKRIRMGPLKKYPHYPMDKLGWPMGFK